jgi:hypothetical protein
MEKIGFKYIGRTNYGGHEIDHLHYNYKFKYNSSVVIPINLQLKLHIVDEVGLHFRINSEINYFTKLWPEWNGWNIVEGDNPKMYAKGLVDYIEKNLNDDIKKGIDRITGKKVKDDQLHTFIEYLYNDFEKDYIIRTILKADETKKISS